jgi:DNA-binding transcriptional LysR family regulator
VNRIMNDLQEGKREIQALLDPNFGEVSFGFMPTLGTYLIPNLISSFRSDYPKVNFRLKQNNTDLLLKQLEANEIDFCLVSFIEESTKVKWKKLWSEELFLIVPADHHLANMESITLQAIANEPFVLLEKGNGLRSITDQLFKEAGINPKITFEGEEVHTITAFVAAGLGVTVIPDFKGVDWEKVSRIRIDSPNCKRAIGLAWVEDRYLSPTAKRFQQFIMNYFTDK